ncbi:MAG: hypothetical protein ACLGH0_08100 [Thermoanaerobaculia bacterium]
MKKAVLLWGGYTLLWIASRWPAIRHNPLFHDDYGIPLDPALFYVGSYRPVVWLEYQFWELLIRDHFWTVLPKLTGAAYLGATATALAFLLRRWDVPWSIAILTPAVALANPVLNDAGLWSSLHALPLGLLFMTLAALFWDRPLIAFAFVIAGVLTYQIFITLALVYIATEWVLKRDKVWRKVAIVAVAGVLQILYMEVVRATAIRSDGRGFVRAQSLAFYIREKFHGVFDLVVNGIMPVVAYYAGALHAYSWWRVVPLAIAIATLIAALWQRRRGLELAIAFLFPIVILFIPALPILMMSQSPYVWRVSSPVAIAFALSLVPLVLSVRRAVPLLAVVALVMLPVSFYEAQMRVVSHERQASLIRELEQHWRTKNVTIVYGPMHGPFEDIRLIGPHDLTWGYERRTPAMWTSFEDAWFAKAFVHTYHRKNFIDCSAGSTAPICARARTLCPRNCTDASVPYPRVMHLEKQTTLICPGALPGSATQCGPFLDPPDQQ